MSFPEGKRKFYGLGPVAVKLHQGDVCAPEHDSWEPIIACVGCDAEYKAGHNRIYGSRSTETECIEELKQKLLDDHRDGRPHNDIYELNG